MNSQDNASSRRWIQFSLHTLMALIVAACVAVAWFTQVPFVDIAINDIRILERGTRIEYLCHIDSSSRRKYDCRVVDENGKFVTTPRLTELSIEQGGDQRKIVIYATGGPHFPYLPEPMYVSPVGFDPSWRNPVPTLAKGGTYRITDDRPLKVVRFMAYDGKPVYFYVKLNRQQ